MNTGLPDKLLTAEEAARFLQVSKAQLYRMASTGQIRFVPHKQHRMRFSPLELESYRWHTTSQGTQLSLPKPTPRKRRHEVGEPLIDRLPVETLTAPEAAAYLGMKLDTFYWRVRHGQVTFLPAPGQRGKRFRKNDLDAYREELGKEQTLWRLR
ncbi:MAG: helix-turn-helix domain-containing protein [Armatimonadota bacterium]